MEQDISLFCPPHTVILADINRDPMPLSIATAAVDLDEFVRELRADPSTPRAVLSPGKQDE